MCKKRNKSLASALQGGLYEYGGATREQVGVSKEQRGNREEEREREHGRAGFANEPNAR